MTQPVLLTTDFSSNSRRAYPAAVHLARQTGAPIRLLHIIEHLFAGWSSDTTLSWDENKVAEASRNGLEADAATLRREGVEVQTVLRSGSVVSQITSEAEVCSALVLATHGFGGAKGLLLGSTAGRLLRTCMTPLLTVGPDATEEPKGLVLAPIDIHEPPCRGIVDELQRLGQQVDQIELYHAIQSPSAVLMDPTMSAMWNTKIAEEILVIARTRLEEHATLVRTGSALVTMHIEHARRPAEAIAERARSIGAKLIVMSAHGTRGVTRLFAGSVAEEVIRTAPCPVFTLRRKPSV